MYKKRILKLHVANDNWYYQLSLATFFITSHYQSGNEISTDRQIFLPLFSIARIKIDKILPLDVKGKSAVHNSNQFLIPALYS
jgi:hypothetical protein